MQVELASIDSEQAVLGSIVIDPDAIFDIMHELKPHDFSLGIHKHIYDAAMILADASEPVDAMTISNVLERKGITEYRNNPIFSYLIDLTNIVPTALNIKSYAHQVKHDATRRALVDAAGKINTIAVKNDISTEQMIASASATIEGIGTDKKAKLSTARDAAAEFLAELENDKPVGIKSGLIDLDRCVGGLEGGNGYWICAAEKMGKTSLANSISLYNAMNGRVVCRISAEMGKKQRMRRDIAALTGISIQKLKRKDLTPKEMQIAMETVGKLSETRMIIDDARGVTPSQIRATLHSTILKYGTVDLLEVDYFQLLEADKATSNRVSDLETISRKLVNIIGEFNVPMIMTAQVLSKSIDQRQEKRPNFSDIFGSSAPMKDAYFVSFLYRDEYYNPDTTSWPGEGELIVRAHRDGDTPTIGLVFDGPTATFKNKDYSNAINL